MLKDYNIYKEDLEFLLQKRCDVHNLHFKSNGSFTQFTIKEKLTSRPRIIRFQQNQAFKSNVIRVTDKHLVSLYNPNYLFSVFDCLKNVSNFTGLELSILNDELVIVNSSVSENDTISNELFQKMIEKFDLIDRNSKVFKIQLALDNCFAINRCFKISANTLNQILRFKEISLEPIFDLAITYFNCFKKAPVCCRMQSIADNAEVFDFDIYSYSYVIKNRHILVKLSKTIFTFILNVEDKILERDYLEIVPVNLIHFRKPENIIALIKQYGSLKPQPNGMFTVKGASNISLENLFSDLSGQNITFFNYFEHYTQLWVDNNKERHVKDFFSFLEKYRSDEGIGLTFAEVNRDSFTYISISTVEDSIMEKGQLNDYFYYSSKVLVAFFEEMTKLEKSGDLIGISFEVTQYGSIIFNNYCEIMPGTFLLVKDSKKLVKEIAKFCDTMVCDPDTDETRTKLRDEIKSMEARYSTLTDDEKIKLFQNKDNLSRLHPYMNSIAINKIDFIYRVHPKFQNFWELYSASKSFLRNVARHLNSVLKKLQDEYFELQSFLCMPDGILGFLEHEQNNTEKILKELREKHHIKLAMFSPCDIFQLECLQYRGLNLIIRTSIDSLEHIISFLDLVEKINELVINNGKLVVVSRIGEMCIVRGKDFFYHEVKNSNTLAQVQNLKECLEIIFKDKQCVGLMFNENLIFENYLSIKFQTFLILQIERNEIYKAARLYKIFRQNLLCTPDHWISLVRKKNLQQNIFDNYVELVKILNPILLDLEEKMLVNEYFEILPTNIIPFSKCFKEINSDCILQWEEAVSSLLLKNLYDLSMLKITAIISGKNWECFKPFVDRAGTIQTKYCKLPASKWLQLSNVQKFNSLSEKFSNFLIKIHSTGFYGFEDHEKNEIFMCYLHDQKTSYKLLSKQQLGYCLSHPNKNLNYIINSNGDIKVGKFVWFRPSLGINSINVLLQIIADFDDIFGTQDENLMKSVLDFEHHQAEAIQLAKLFNPMLEDLPETMLNNHQLKIFPNDLYIAWHVSETSWETTYKKLVSIFRTLKEKSMIWFLKHNGHFEIEFYLVVTVENLLKIEDYDSFEKFFKTDFRKHIDYKLICKEEIMYGKNREEQIYNTVRNSVSAVEARNNMNEFFRLRFESNLTFLFNHNLWIRPEDFIDNKKSLMEVSKLIHANFGENNRFQFGTPGSLMAKSLLQKDSEQFYEFSQNILNYVSEKYPNDDNVLEITFNDDNSSAFINNLLWINSRTFFHLSEINDAMDIFVKYRDIKLTDPLSDEAKNFLIDLKKIGDNRLEFDPKRNYCLILIAKIFLKQKEIDPNFLKDDLKGDESEMYGIENLKVGGEEIFKEGTTSIFLNQRGEIDFDKSVILLTLKYAEYLSHNDERNKCKRLFDFSSLTEIVHYYCLLNTENPVTENDKLQRKKPRKDAHEIYTNTTKFNEMTNFLKTQINLVRNQQENQRFVFQKRYELKGLHHWLKHGQDFDNIGHYFMEMNKFFEENVNNYSTEIEMQNGGVLNRNYKNDTYEGVLMITTESLYEGSFNFDVVSFKKVNNSEYFSDFKDEKMNEFLIITDESFGFSLNAIMNRQIQTTKDFIFFPEEKKANGKINNATVINIENILTFPGKKALTNDKKIWKSASMRATVEQAQITLNPSNAVSPDFVSFQIKNFYQQSLFSYIVFIEDSYNQLKNIADLVEKIDNEEEENVKHVLVAIKNTIEKGRQSDGEEPMKKYLQEFFNKISVKFSEAKILVVFENYPFVNITLPYNVYLGNFNS